MTKNLSELLDKQAKKIPDKIYLSNLKDTYSFSEFNFLVNKCCNYFNQLGINQKDIISICLSNKIEFLILYFATIRYGSTFFLLSINDTVNQIEDKLSFVKSTVLFIDSGSKIEILNKELNTIYVENNFINKLKVFNSYFSKSLLNENEIVGYYSSSGTTNESKIICYSHKNMISGIETIYKSNLFKNIKKHLCFLPLFHTSALRYSIKSSLINGSEVLIIKNFWSIKDNIWKIIVNNKIDFFQLVPSILNIILKNPNTNNPKDLSNNLKFCGCGSSFLPINDQIDFEKKFNIKLLNLYGLSEIGASHYEDPNKRKIGSIGKPFDKYDVRILDNNLKDCAVNESGQIAVKGDPVFKKYLNSKNEKVFFDQYFLTGDFAYKDKDGFFFFVDRTKDIIIKGGTNISPNEIDSVINGFKGVIESATIPIEDKFYGEVPYTFIVVQSDNFTNLNQLKLYCKDLLGEFKTPAGIEIINIIPKGPSGKILRRVLKKNVNK